MAARCEAGDNEIPGSAPTWSGPGGQRGPQRTGQADSARWFGLFPQWFPVVLFSSHEPVFTGSPVPWFKEPGTRNHSCWLQGVPEVEPPIRLRVVRLAVGLERGVDRVARTPALARHVALFEKNVDRPQGRFPFPPASLATLFLVSSPGCASIARLARCKKLVGRNAVCSLESALREAPGAPTVTSGGETVESMMMRDASWVRSVLLNDPQ
jgi:hypothetical protein